MHFQVSLIFLYFLVTPQEAFKYSPDDSENREKGPDAPGCPVDKKYHRNPLVVVALDGFHVDYLKKGLTPNLNKLVSSGVKAKHMRSQFPTVTAPNMISVMTGLYPESHGIIDNCMNDRKLKKVFCCEESCSCTGQKTGFTGSDPVWFKNIEPIWITARKNKLFTALHGWRYGGEAPIQNLEANYKAKHHSKSSLQFSMQYAMKWFDLPPYQRPSLISIYSGQTDTAGHSGPFSKRIKDNLKDIDAGIGQLMKELKDRQLQDCVNIILFSDHGMALENQQKMARLQKYASERDNSIWKIHKPRNLGPLCSWKPVKGADPRAIHDDFIKENCHLKVFMKKELPKRLHYAHNRRIPEVIAVADERWPVTYNKTTHALCPCGKHGLDPVENDMKALFVGYGPSFKRGFVAEPFENTEVYNLMTALLRIKPATNNGTYGSLNHLLKRPDLHEVKVEMSDDDEMTDIFKVTSKPDYDKCTQCFCTHCKPSKARRLTRKLDMNDAMVRSIQEVHFPWGKPRGGSGKKGIMLTQPGYVVGYDGELRTPLWVGYKITGPTLARPGKINKHKADSGACIMRDPRLNEEQSSHCYNYTNPSVVMESLTPPIDVDAKPSPKLLSTMFPMYRFFKEETWSYVTHLIKHWSQNFSPLFVITGSIFDKNFDGVRDEDADKKEWFKDGKTSVPVPSHYYAIAVRCLPVSSSLDAGINGVSIPFCNGKLDSLSFVLPHLKLRPQYYGNNTLDNTLIENVATIRDIELLSGANFFTELRPDLQAQLKTRLPTKLWQTLG